MHIRVFVFLPRSVCLERGRSCLPSGVGPVRTRLPHSMPHVFINASAADRFSTICKNRSFIKEKGFHHPDDFFRKTIEAKGWRALCQPPRPAGDECGTRILRQTSPPMSSKSSGCEVYWSTSVRSRSIASMA